MIRAVAFDWGGVFTEGTFDQSAIVALARRAGVEPTSIERPYLDLMADFETGAFDMTGFHARFVETTGTELDEPTFTETFLGAVRERTAMFAILGAIPADYTVGMLSNNVPVLCDRVRHDPRMQRIERFVFSNEIGVRKPDAAAFAALTEALEVPPEATVFIDDAERNVVAARALGYAAIHIVDLDAFLADWRALLPDVPTGIDPEA
ncbi:MAG: HAD family phosphatase [Trueperaceae bacterium]|nr:HAD family phosphatase [Trueperaceae bacterium]